MPLNGFLSSHGIKYIVRRADCEDREEKGLANREVDTKRAYISFMPGTDIKANDVLINPAGEAVYVIETQTAYFSGRPNDLRAFYQTERERRMAVERSAPVFNIQNAYGSVIGTGNNATINYRSAINDLKAQVQADVSSDKEDLEKIVSLLEMIVNDQISASKGLFSKFSSLMERNFGSQVLLRQRFLRG